MSKARDIADLDFNAPDIDGGNIDGATIGGTTPAAGTFSAFTSTGIDDNATSTKFTVSDSGASVTGDIFITDTSPSVTFTDNSVTNLEHKINSSSDNLTIRADVNDVDAGSRVEVFVTNQSSVRFNKGSTVFNEAGEDVDFRVESDSNSNAFFVQGNTSRVGINEPSPDNALHVKSGSDNLVLKLESTDTEAGIELRDTTGAAYLKSRADFRFEVNSADVVKMFANETIVNDAGADYDFRVESDGNANMLLVNGGNNSVSIGTSNSEATFTVGGSATFNADSADADFRVESNGNANMLFVDGGNNRVGVGTSSPNSTFESHGTFTVRSSSSSTFNDSNNSENVRMLDGSTHFNADGVDKDFRVESNNNTHALFVDGSNDRVSIRNSSEINSGALSVNGTITFNNQTAGTYNHASGFMDFSDAGAANLLRLHAGGDPGEYSKIEISTNIAGVQSDAISVENTGPIVINQDSIAARDFRVESDTNTHALFVDAGNSRVGINQTAPKGDFHVTGGADSLIFIDGTTSVANSPTTLFTINLPGVANAVFVTLFVRGIANGIAWLGFKQDFVAARGGSILATAGQVVETAGGGTMTLNVSGSDLNVQFNHVSSVANTMTWNAVIQGNPGTIS